MPIPHSLARRSGFALDPIKPRANPAELVGSAFLQNGIPSRDDEVAKNAADVEHALNQAVAKAAAEIPIWTPPNQRVSKERKLYTASRKRWKNVGRRFSSPFASMLRTKRKPAKQGGERGMLMLYDCDTKKRIKMADEIEELGFAVVREGGAPAAAIAALKKNISLEGAIVAVNSNIKHESAIEFLSLLGKEEKKSRLAKIPIALLLDAGDANVVLASHASSPKHSQSIRPSPNRRRASSTTAQVEHLKRGFSAALMACRQSARVRVELQYPSNSTECELLIQRYIMMVKHEQAAVSEDLVAQKWDLSYQKLWLRHKEHRKLSAGHKAAGSLVNQPRRLKRKTFRAWKEYVQKRKLDPFSKFKDDDEEDGATKKGETKKKGMVRGRKQFLMKRLRTAGKGVSVARQALHRTIMNSITEERLLNDIILPNWLPSRMVHLYMQPLASERDSKRAIRIFTRFCVTRADAWVHACKALTIAQYALHKNKKYLGKAERELTACLAKRQPREQHDLLYNRSVVFVRLGETKKALKDLNAVIEAFESGKSKAEAKFRVAALFNRSLIHRRFGNFIMSNADITKVHELTPKEQAEEKTPDPELGEKNDANIDVESDRRPRSNSDNVLSCGGNKHTDDSDAEQPVATRFPRIESQSANNFIDALRLNKTKAEAKNNKRGNQDKLDRDLASIISNECNIISSSSSSSCDSDSDSSSEEESSNDSDDADAADKSAPKEVFNTSHVARSRGRRGSMLSSIRLKAGVAGHIGRDGHALEVLQNFVDTEKRREIDSKIKDGPQPHEHVSKTNVHAQSNRILDKLRVLPSDVVEALRVDPQLRTRKHLKDIRFVTDTMEAFCQLPTALRDHLTHVLTLEEKYLNDHVCTQGDKAKDFYVIVQGRCRVAIKNPADPTTTLVVNHMQAGQSFGELALVFNQRRMASVIVDERRATFLVVPGAQFRLMGFAQYHLSKLQDKYKTLCECNVFNSWSDESLTAIAQVAQVKAWKPGQVIVKQDTPPDYFHILRRGVATVSATSDELGELRREEAALSFDIDRKSAKNVVHRKCHADAHVRAAKEEQEEMQKRMCEVKKCIKRCVLVPKEKSSTSIATIFAPQFCGENAVLQPDRREMSTVTASSWCETLQISRAQIKAKWISQEFIYALRRGSVNIPKGEVLHVMRQVNDEWDEKKKDCVHAEIDQSRHPPRPEDKQTLWY